MIVFKDLNKTLIFLVMKRFAESICIKLFKHNISRHPDFNLTISAALFIFISLVSVQFCC